MRKTVLGLCAATFVAMFAVGCDSNSDADSDSFDGLWAYVTPDDEEDEDVLYVHFNGERVTIYDFRGDEWDGGPDCYTIERGTMERVEDNEYEFTSDAGASFTVTLRRNGNRLTFDYGGGFAIEIYARSNADVDDFEPECEEEDLDFVVPAPLLKGADR